MKRDVNRLIQFWVQKACSIDDYLLVRHSWAVNVWRRTSELTCQKMGKFERLFLVSFKVDAYLRPGKSVSIRVCYFKHFFCAAGPPVRRCYWAHYRCYLACIVFGVWSLQKRKIIPYLPRISKRILGIMSRSTSVILIDFPPRIPFCNFFFFRRNVEVHQQGIIETCSLPVYYT